MASLFLSFVALTPAGAATRNVERTADKVFPYLEPYLALPPAERTGFSLSYRLLEPVTLKPAPVRLTLVRGGEATVLPLEPDGRISVQPGLADLRARSKMTLEIAGGGKIMESLDILSTQPLRSDYAATDFNVGLAQANAGVKKAAGMFSIVAPHFTRVVFEGAGSGEMIDASGKAVPLPVSKSGPAFDPEGLKSARSIRLARVPERITFAPAKD
jgi:hypothetical protein